MKRVFKKLFPLFLSLALMVSFMPTFSVEAGTKNQVTSVVTKWSNGGVYTQGDVVSWNGYNWEASWWTQGEEPGKVGEWGVWKKAGNTPVEPEIPVEPETPVNPTGTWKSSVVYTGGKIVTWNGVEWKAGWWTQGDEPGKGGDWGVWKKTDGKPVNPDPVDPQPPLEEKVAAPTGLTAKAVGKNTVDVTWNPVAGAIGYELKVDGEVINITGVAYTHTGLKSASTHNYEVRVKPAKAEITYLWSMLVKATTDKEPVVPGPISDQVLVGYWHNFDNGSTNIRLRDIPQEWDVVQVAFGETLKDRAVVEFAPYNATDAEFRSDVEYLKNRGVQVLLSLGGQNGVLHIDSPADVDKFVKSVTNLIDKYGFNGFDIDVENGITVSAADKNLKNPSTPRIKYMVEGINKICDNYGDDFWLTMAPEIAYVQGGITAFAGPWGAYLPIIEGTRHNLTMLHVQHYNCGGNTGLDGMTYNAGTADFQVAMVDMLLQGFNIGGDPNAFFEPLRPDQVGIGIPAKPSAAPAGGYIAPEEMKKALDYLIKGKSYGGKYKLQEPTGYPGFRGLMTWSINWDATQGNSFAKTYKAYFNSL